MNYKMPRKRLEEIRRAPRVDEMVARLKAFLADIDKERDGLPSRSGLDLSFMCAESYISELVSLIKPSASRLVRELVEEETERTGQQPSVFAVSDEFYEAFKRYQERGAELNNRPPPEKLVLKLEHGDVEIVKK